MFGMRASDFRLTMAACLLGLGAIFLVIGIVILLTRVLGKDISTIAAQTAKLAQKGIAEDVAGLVGNASGLVDALNQLVRTAAGIGIFFIIIGLLLIAIAYSLAIQL
jgi:tellurite resistance protein TehA-like permease